MAVAPALRTKLDDFLRPALARLQTELAAAEHGRWLLIGAGALIWVAICVFLTVRVSDAHRRHGDLQVEVNRLETLVGDTSWQGKLQQSEALKFQLNERLWTAATPGLAKAAFEQWIRERVTKHGLEAPQVGEITLSPAAIQSAGGTRTLPGVQKMTAKVNVVSNPNGLAGFAAEMIESDKIAILDQLTVRTTRAARTEMNISTFVRLSEGAVP